VMANGVIFVIARIVVLVSRKRDRWVNRLRIYRHRDFVGRVFIPCVPVADWVRRSMFLGRMRCWSGCW